MSYGYNSDDVQENPTSLHCSHKWEKEKESHKGLPLVEESRQLRAAEGEETVFFKDKSHDRIPMPKWPTLHPSTYGQH